MEDAKVQPATSGETPTQQQARLRRERREAKIKAGGSARLDKITQLSGRAAELAPPASTTRPAQSQGDHTPDPDEVDITNHPYSSRNNANPTAESISRVLRNRDPEPNNGQHNPFASMSGMDSSQSQGGDEDPMLRMLQQMMGGGLPGGGDEGGVPPGLAAMFGGGVAQSVEENKTAYIWKIVHAVLALALGLYMVTSTTFHGGKMSRLEIAHGEPRRNFFWVFATAELMLQSLRFFLEGGRGPQKGILAMVTGFLPEPWRGYVGLVARYSGIYSTVVEDAMVVVFVLGLMAWWKGAVG